MVSPSDTPPNESAVPGPYRLAPRPDQHLNKSRDMILEAASRVDAGRAIILGAGRCEEIPLAELAARFQRVVLSDQDATLLAEAIDRAGLSADQRQRVELQAADLTGLTDSLVADFEAVLKTAASLEEAIDRMAEFTDAASFPSTSVDQQYDLVVASCVLSQLHVAALQRGRQLFGQRFAGQEPRLDKAPAWGEAMYRLARRMEVAFVDLLSALLAPGGRIFLSETVQMCFITGAESGDWSAPGSYRLTHSLDLAHYLDRRFRIERRDRWDWVLSPPQSPGQQGRLFDVQALILSRA